MATYNKEDNIKWNDLSTSLQDIIMRKITWNMLHPDLQSWLLDKERRIIELERWRRTKVDPMLDDHENRINILENKMNDVERFIEDTKKGDSSVVNGYGDMFNGLPHFWTVCSLGNLSSKIRTDYWFTDEIYSPFNNVHGGNKDFTAVIPFPTTYNTIVSFSATREILINAGYVDTVCYFSEFSTSSVRVFFNSVVYSYQDHDTGSRFGCVAVGLI